MKFKGYWSSQLLVAEFRELLSCCHYYRDCEYYEPGDWVVKASLGLGARLRSYFICPIDKTVKEGYRPFRDREEANAFIEKMLENGTELIDLGKLGACCAFMEDTYPKVELLEKLAGEEE